MTRPGAFTPELVDLRERVERYLGEQFGSADTDDAGDFMVGLGGTAVWIRPELWTQGRTLARVWVITNVGMRVDAELGRFLLDANAHLPFGGLRLDESRPAVVFADVLVGEYLNRAELLVAVAAAASAATQLAPEIKERFGGSLFTEI